jgi:hypothetical protein
MAERVALPAGFLVFVDITIVYVRFVLYLRDPRLAMVLLLV